MYISPIGCGGSSGFEVSNSPVGLDAVISMDAFPASVWIE